MLESLAPFVAALLVLVATPTAQAAQRYAVPGGSTTSQCPVADPCAIERAVNGAAAGDEVIVASGDYTLTAPAEPRGALDLHGDADQMWPRIIAAGKVSGTALTFKGGDALARLAAGREPRPAGARAPAGDRRRHPRAVQRGHGSDACR